MTTNYCIVSFVLSMLILLIVGFTCPPTVYFTFITKCGKCCYKLRQLVTSLLQPVTNATSGTTMCDNIHLMSDPEGNS